MTDAEWAVVAPLLPKPSDRGRRRRWEWREVLDAIFYVLRAGCPWRFLPDSFLPWRTGYRWFGELRDTGGFEDLNHHLVQMDRVHTGREPMPLGSRDRQSERKNHRVWRPERLRCRQEGQRAQAPCRGRHRWPRAELLVHSADVQDRDGAVPLLKISRGRHPFVKLAYADSAYVSSRVAMAEQIERLRPFFSEEPRQAAC